MPGQSVGCSSDCVCGHVRLPLWIGPSRLAVAGDVCLGSGNVLMGVCQVSPMVNMTVSASCTLLMLIRGMRPMSPGTTSE